MSSNEGLKRNSAGAAWGLNPDCWAKPSYLIVVTFSSIEEKIITNYETKSYKLTSLSF